jgi:hypothetical protein
MRGWVWGGLEGVREGWRVDMTNQNTLTITSLARLGVRAPTAVVDNEKRGAREVGVRLEAGAVGGHDAVVLCNEQSRG